MNLGITGASGFLGQNLIDLALRRGHEVIAFSRNPARAIPGCEMRPFSIQAVPDISGCEAIIHLAGESLVGLWTPAKKRQIRESRILGTQRLVEAINQAKEPPEVFISGSAIGYYGDGGDTELTESAPAGRGFLPEIVADWEAEALKARGTRIVLLRTSVVLGKNEGPLKLITPLFRCGLGGPLGTGRQWMSWIHIEDEVRLILFAVENMDISGPLNATAPWPIRNDQFTTTLAKRLRRPAFLRVPTFCLRLLGEFRHELLESKRVVPESASAHGFGFKFPELNPALKNLLG